MDRQLLLHWSFVAGIVGGIVIIAGSLLMLAMMGMMGGMMAQMWPMPWMGSGSFTTMAIWMVGWSAVVGTVVLVSALQVRGAPSPLGWGVAMVVAGILSFPVMGGFLLGALAAIAAGVLAILASSPSPEGRPPPA